ncbi:hypothetical protein HC251_02400 [Iamia sp. SCSIO 61187]|uniref:hypothetical protein n=1 Tax=Iamia sp. SCSIO 61187 TaxID=2722752 RepID=UPI001C62BD27|nr:hypothetical protein [Iamia sp. SCSIO 61187]QYG91397.1 hypothetical protein HC251_02400 [Iamia sp. SCSIO 61187]
MSPTWSDLDDAAAADPWPTATLDPGARVRALAAGLPGAVVQEGVLAAPFGRVWGFIADLERSVPTFDVDVAALRILRRDGTRLRVLARSSWRLAGAPLGFDVDLEDGWCWMVSRPRLYVVAMAAAPDPADPGRTRYAHMEGLALSGRALAPLLRVTRRRTRRHVASDVAGIERALGIGP